MKRLLIAMLALLTGLAVQAAPATARVGELAVGAEVGAVGAIRAAKTARAERKSPDFRSNDLPLLAAVAKDSARGDVAFAAPTVRLGPDRARE